MEIHGDKSPHRLTEMKSRTVVARNWGAGGGCSRECGVNCNRQGVSAGEDEKVLEIDDGDGYITRGMHLRLLNCTRKSS